MLFLNRLKHNSKGLLIQDTNCVDEEAYREMKCIQMGLDQDA